MAELHQAVARTLLALVSDPEACNAAILGAATKFLKDNDITCVIEDNSTLSEMQKKIQERQARRKFGGSNVVPLAGDVSDDEAAAAVEAAIAMNGS
jgi:hypothetical protein